MNRCSQRGGDIRQGGTLGYAQKGNSDARDVETYVLGNDSSSSASSEDDGSSLLPLITRSPRPSTPRQQEIYPVVENEELDEEFAMFMNGLRREVAGGHTKLWSAFQSIMGRPPTEHVLLYQPSNEGKDAKAKRKIQLDPQTTKTMNAIYEQFQKENLRMNSSSMHFMRKKLYLKNDNDIAKQLREEKRIAAAAVRYENKLRQRRMDNKSSVRLYAERASEESSHLPSHHIASSDGVQEISAVKLRPTTARSSSDNSSTPSSEYTPIGTPPATYATNSFTSRKCSRTQRQGQLDRQQQLPERFSMAKKTTQTSNSSNPHGQQRGRQQNPAARKEDRMSRHDLSNFRFNADTAREGPAVYRESPTRTVCTKSVKPTISDSIGDAIIKMNESLVKCIFFPFRNIVEDETTLSSGIEVETLWSGTEVESKESINMKRMPYDPLKTDFNVLTSELMEISNMIREDAPRHLARQQELTRQQEEHLNKLAPTAPWMHLTKQEEERLNKLAPKALWMYINGERRAKVFTSDHIRSLLKLFCDEASFASKSTLKRKYLLAELDRINAENPDLLQVTSRLYS